MWDLHPQLTSLQGVITATNLLNKKRDSHSASLYYFLQNVFLGKINY
jgi:hypothetical protein